MRRPVPTAAAILLALAAAAVADDPPTFDAAAIEFFEKEVRPILVDRCVECHGPGEQKSGLRLDSRPAAVAGGLTGPAVEPGKPGESLLVEAIGYADFLQMPPKSKLPEAEIRALTRWVEMGAPWPAEAATGGGGAPKVEPFDLEARAGFWSFRPIARPEPPAVADAAWPLNPIDRFLLARVEAAGLDPAPEADRRTLIRRLAFDLTGLPPSDAEVEDFLNDPSPEAYERLVDRILASPAYGERWGRHWLDLVRYAETAGHEFDYDLPNAWRYRDYVVEAFNEDLPFDRFAVEHLAGDLLPDIRRDPVDGANRSVLGTGFFFLGEGTHSPVDIREEQARRIDNQLDVMGKAFLGLTVACARCHDHKFDPIRQADYYALAGFLKSSRHQQAFLDAPDRLDARVASLRARKAAIATPRLGPEATARLAAHVSTARGLLQAPQEVAPDTSGHAVVFADFEGDTYDGWTAEGEAFGDGPIHLPLPSYQGDVACRGRGLVGSHNGRVAGGVGDRDALTGTLTSPEFTVERPYVGFLVGGGTHEGATCIELLVDGQVVRSTTGRNENRMRWHAFEVRDLAGRKARLRVVDRATGGWGNISLDHVVFTDDPADPADPATLAARLAEARGLDPGLLGRWVAALGDPEARSPGHPLAALWGSNGGAGQGGDPLVLADFDGPDYGGWTATGQAFGDRPTRPGDWRPGADGPVPVASGLAHSGLVADQLRGVLRSPTFTIEHPFLRYRAWGRGGRISLVIDGFEKIRSPIYGGLTFDVQADRPRWFVQDVSMWRGHRAYVELADGASVDFTGGNSRVLGGEGFLAVDEVRFADSPGTPAETSPFGRESADEFAAAVAAALNAPQVAPPADVEATAWMLDRGLLPVEATDQEAYYAYQAEAAELPSPALGLAIADGPGEDEFLLIRGDHKRPGEPVPRSFLEVFRLDGSTPEPTYGPGSGRLELARRVVDAEVNPLTPRVLVNRLWHHHFGRGIVPTPDDFGKMGQPPSHPELLDWLATRLIDSGWSVKTIQRLIVTSRAYRMDSTPNPDATAIDPENRLLHRANVRRLEAEALRDAMLAVSGRLDPRVGGPSVAPHLTPFMEGRGRPSKSGPLDGDGRRSLYLGVRRNFLTPFFLAFDYPPPATCMGRRNVSNVPAQALTLLNDPFVIEQARLWADRVKAEPGTDAERVDRMYRDAFARPATESERAAALGFLGDEPGGDDWAALAHVLFNVKEFLFVP